jgi:hypothetical protein
MKTTAERFLAGEGLGIGVPMKTSEPTTEAPVDWSNRGPKSKQPPKQARQPGQLGKGPVQTIGDQSDKAPSERVGQTVEQKTQLTTNPFDAGKSPKKMDKKKEGNPGELGDKDFKTNLWVPARTTQQAFSEWFKATYGGRWHFQPRRDA